MVGVVKEVTLQREQILHRRVPIRAEAASGHFPDISGSRSVGRHQIIVVVVLAVNPQVGVIPQFDAIAHRAEAAFLAAPPR